MHLCADFHAGPSNEYLIFFLIMNKSYKILPRSSQDISRTKSCHIFLRSYQDLVKIFARYSMYKSYKILPRYFQDISRTNLARSYQHLCKIFVSNLSRTNLSKSFQIFPYLSKIFTQTFPFGSHQDKLFQEQIFQDLVQFLQDIFPSLFQNVHLGL